MLQRSNLRTFERSNFPRPPEEGSHVTGIMEYWPYWRQFDAVRLGHRILGDDCACFLQGPGRVMNIAPVHASATVLGIVTVALSQPVLKRALVGGKRRGRGAVRSREGR